MRTLVFFLENWYLGDLAAVERGLGTRGLAAQQGRRRYRAADQLANAKQELRRLTNGSYQEVGGSRAIGVWLDPDRNSSRSFAVFVAGVRRLVSTGRPTPLPGAPCQSLGAAPSDP